MKLVSVYRNPASASSVLYQLLEERPVENRISHKKMPTHTEHIAFIMGEPFRYWFLIQEGSHTVGAMEITHLNEIGIAILKKYQNMGYAKRALKMFLESYDPLPPIAAKRNARWLANIAVGNEDSKRFFMKMGFKALQETWIL